MTRHLLLFAATALLTACGGDDEAEPLPHEVCEEVDGLAPCCMPPDPADCSEGDAPLMGGQLRRCGSLWNITYDMETGAVRGYQITGPEDSDRLDVGCSLETGRMTVVGEFVAVSPGTVAKCLTKCWSEVGEPEACDRFADCPDIDWPPTE